jgi:hypothetical protein
MSTTILNTCTRPTGYHGNNPVHQSVLKASAQLELLKYLLSKGCPSELALEIVSETDSTNYIVQERYQAERQANAQKLQAERWQRAEQVLLDFLNYRQNNTSSLIVDLRSVLNGMAHRNPQTRLRAKNILARVLEGQVRIHSTPIPARTLPPLVTAAANAATPAKQVSPVERHAR